MVNSDMRTIVVRFSTAEHRVLHDLAAAQEVSVETLVREALGLVPVDAARPAGPRLEVVGGTGAVATPGDRRSDAVPIN